MAFAFRLELGANNINLLCTLYYHFMIRRRSLCSTV